MSTDFAPDVIVVGAGLAGLVATHELVAGRPAGAACSTRRTATTSAARRSGRSAGCSSSTPPSSAGWASRTRPSSPSRTGSARPASTGRDDEDVWPRQWAEAYVEFAATREARLPARARPAGAADRRLGRARRRHARPATATRCRASTSPGAPAPRWSASSPSRCWPARQRGLVEFGFRHRVDDLVVEDGARRRRTRHRARAERRPARGVKSVARGGRRVRAARARRGRHQRRHRPQPRPDPAELAGRPARPRARAHDLRRARPRGRPDARRSPRPPAPRIVNRDRMWHYTEGIHNWDPIWPDHAIRIIPGPSSMWFDATGQRLPAPNFPGFDSLGTLRADPGRRPRLLVVRAHPVDHREGVRALGLRAEPRHHRQGPASSCSRAGWPRARPGRSRRSRSTARTSSSPTTSPTWSPG